MQTSRIGPFALEERLQGAEHTFRGVHLEQRRSVAVRVFSAPFGVGREAKLAFAGEWERLKALKHRNIVRCFGGGLDEMRGYLALELVQGESIRELLKRRGRWPWDQVVDLALQIVAALEFAHEHEISHLALAPEKLILAADGTLKVADFRWQRHQQSAFQTPTGLTPQRAAYQAPEQFDKQANVGPKADMYALGCILYEMLTGRPPFVAVNIDQLAESHCRQEPERVSRRALDCPIWLDSIVHQLLEKDPLKRPHSIAMVRLALEETRKKMLEGVSVAEHVTSGISPLKTDANRSEAAELLGRRKKKKRRKASSRDATPFWEKAWFLVLCLLALIAVGTWILWPLSEEQLFRRAMAVIETREDGADQRARRDYLEPLLRRFPNGQYAAQAQAELDRMEMELAETRLRLKLKLGRELRNEGERLLAEAWEFQQFGDRQTAKEKYQSMLDLLPADQELSPYRKLARREIAALEQNGPGSDRQAFLEERLRNADELATEGKQLEADRIWRSIISLYRNNAELQTLVSQAEDRLARRDPQADRDGQTVQEKDG
jgi:eukaryotic-like serine/threonine-protein kinase